MYKRTEGSGGFEHGGHISVCFFHVGEGLGVFLALTEPFVIGLTSSIESNIHRASGLHMRKAWSLWDNEWVYRDSDRSS